jgi:hypothetical protein
MTGTAGTRAEPALLGIYLNDHLAGATGGLELARRAAGAQPDTDRGKQLATLATEIAEDRDALVAMMSGLGVPVRQYKVYSAWAAEKVGRLKLNGHLLDRSPLSSLVEVEALRLGVEGKACLWRTLRAIADQDARLDAARLDDLLARAGRQAKILERLRVSVSAEIFGS